MGLVLILFFLAMFLIGVVTGCWQVLKFICNVLVDPKPLYTPGPIKPLYTEPKPAPAPPPVEAPRRIVLTRAQALNVLEAETRRALRAAALSPQTRAELFAYIDRERARLPGAALAETPSHALEPQAAPELIPNPPPEPAMSSAPEPDAPVPAEPVLAENEAPAAALAQTSAPEVPAAEVPKARDPEAIRAIIAKLHADAQAPDVPAPASSEADAALAAPFQPPAQAEPTDPGREEARAGHDVPERMTPVSVTLEPVKIVEVPARDFQTAEALHDEPARAAETQGPPARLFADPPRAVATAPEKTLAERLFTPENVRILQSIGIGIIFISAVAFVRMNMWEGASAWQQLALLLGGTSACMGAGYALRRWTTLRITGLGFLILGQLAIVLDTYAALVHQGAGRPPMYPWSPSSLWMISMLVFSASAWWHARKLDESLFEAFAFFGALAAYGSGAVLAGVAGAAGERWWMMPAAYVPALACCGILAALMHARALASGAEDAHDLRANLGGWRRWTLWWWMDATWKVGAGLLTAFVPAAAVFSGRADLAAQFGWHAAALLGLGVGSIFEALRNGRRGAAGAGAASLLAVVPLYAYAHGWPVEQYALALALPGALLALAALALKRLPGQAEKRAAACAVLRGVGGGLAAFGAAWAFCAWQFAQLNDAHAALCAGSLLALGLALAVVEGEAWGAWAVTFGGGFLLAVGLETLRLDLAWWPAAGLGAALVLHVLWRFVREEEIVAAWGRLAANVLAGGALAQLGWLSLRVLPGVAHVGAGLAASWLALALYLWIVSRTEPAWRAFGLGAGVAALGPAAALGLYALGQPLCMPAPWLSLLALAAQIVAGIFWNEEREAEADAREATSVLRDAVCTGAGGILVLGLLLALTLTSNGAAADAAWAYAAALPAAAGLALRLRLRPRPDFAWVALAEGAVFACFGAAGLETASAFGAGEIVWPLVCSVLGAGALFLSLLGEAFASRRARLEHAGEAAPFQSAGAIAALFWTLAAGLCLLVNLAMPDRALLLQSTWAAALVPLFLALRPQRTKEKDALTWQGLLGGGMAGMLVFFAGVLALSAQCWAAACPASLREACALYFGIVFAASVAAGVLQRRAFAPVTGALALLGLLGCAYGGWHLPVESFGLACMLLAGALGALAAWLEKTPTGHSAQTFAAGISAVLVGLLGGAHLLSGLALWPVGPAHAWGVAAWALLAAGAWAGSHGRMRRGDGRKANALAWASATAGTLALVHGLRWYGTSYFDFGPYLAGAALGLLALRELVRLADRTLLERLREASETEEPRELDPREAAADLHAAVKPRERLGRSGGVLAAALTAGLAAFFFGLAGWWDGLTMHWAATLLMEALGLGALAVTVRRDHEKAFGPLLLVLELGAWASFAGALLVSMHHYAGGLLFTPPMLVLAGAVLFALGMAAEALAGAVLAPERHAASPRPFLESRHLAALGLAGLGVLWALGRSHAFADPAIHSTWRAVLCAGFLAAYAGMAEWSAEDLARRAGRMAAGLASHLLLIPGGYLCLLKAHSTGSSWGALWFLALAPLQLLAANLLDREKHTAQAYLARGGALLVSLGAIALAFFGNAERLAEVPCATFGALLLIALAARRFTAGHERRAYGHAALLALTGTVFFAVRLAAHDPAFGLAETSVWEWPELGALGLLLILAGGATAWEADAKGRSLAGLYGALLAFAAAGASAFQLAAHGMAADYLHVSNVARFEALIVSLLLASGASLAAKRWLNFFAGAYLAPVLAQAGYALYVWTLHPGAWEWYSLPAAALLFVWARSRADEDEARANPAAQQEVSVLLGLGCAAALAPSFAQTLAYTPEALAHYYALVIVGLTLVGGAMFTRRKIPLLSGSAAVLLGTLVKTAQWAAHREVIYPVLGIGIGFAVLAVGCLFESRMNRAIRQTVDRVRAEARMFWVSWE